MTSKRLPDDCMTMDHVRTEIDRLDDILVDLMAERFGYVERAWQLKSQPADARVPWRVQQVIDRVRIRAREQNLSPELVEAIWRQMMGWFIQYEEEKLLAAQGDKRP
jgi:isochorismate pyruvate lyase